MIVFEERSTYDASKDAVATVTLTVECAPGQVADLSQFLVGVSAKAGVYSVAMDHVVAIPVGEANAESPLQPEHLESEAAVERQGSEAEIVGFTSRLDQHEDGVVAGTSGEGSATGQEPGSS